MYETLCMSLFWLSTPNIDLNISDGHLLAIHKICSLRAQIWQAESHFLKKGHVVNMFSLPRNMKWHFWPFGKSFESQKIPKSCHCGEYSHLLNLPNMPSSPNSPNLQHFSIIQKWRRDLCYRPIFKRGNSLPIFIRFRWFHILPF